MSTISERHWAQPEGRLQVTDVKGSWARLTALAGRESFLLAWLLAIHIVLGVYYSVTIPIWEAHDEIGHYYHARYIAAERRLPAPGQRLVADNDEAHQPPLYYILAAAPLSFLDLDDGLEPHLNPYMAWPRAQGGYNRTIHDPARESWPYRGTVLAVHVARWASVLIGAWGVLFTFLTARQLAPHRPAVRWGAALAFTFWPQFRFATAVINNDILMTVVAAAVTWLLVRVVTAPPRWYDIVALGAATGLGLLSKGNGLALPPLVVAVLLGVAVASPRYRARVLAWLLAGVGLGALVVSWWYVRNLGSGMGMFGGERSLSLVSRYLTAMARTVLSPNRELFTAALWHSWRSLWAAFGWNNVGLPVAFYWVGLAWLGGGLLGLLWKLRQRPGRRVAAAGGVLLLTAAVMAGVPFLLRIARGGSEVQGRVLLAALPALCVLLGVGWTALLPGRARSAGWATMGGSLALLSLLAPARWIRPAYAPPPRLSEEQAAQYVPVHASYGGFVELVGFRVDEPYLDPGEDLNLTLVWRALSRTELDQVLAIQLYTHEHGLVGEVQRFPGRGTLSTTTWQPGALFAERATIPVRVSEEHPLAAWAEISYHVEGGVHPAHVHNTDQQIIGTHVRLDGIKIRGSSPPAPVPATAGMGFGPVMRLVAVEVRPIRTEAGARLQLGLEWLATGTPADDYTVSLQLRDSANTIVDQVDSQPLQERYPTSLWEAGERIRDSLELVVPADRPAGVYRLYVCAYDLDTLARLPAVDVQGEALPESEARLLTLTVDAAGALQIEPGYGLVRVE